MRRLEALVTTPLRDLGRRMADGWILVSDSGSTYADGAETRVAEIIAQASDISSSSDELIAQARTWPETYHLTPIRANLLRGLRLPIDGAALEVGAGCGAVTRLLGETCRLVDALEPVPSRAHAARARTRDLAGVEVFVGAVEDIPRIPAYDLIVVVGVLEYVGAGTADLDPYRRFLSILEGLLNPGGTLVVAIENKLGVKYLCGAPEDHSGRPFDSIEGYPYASPARTFSRRELSDMFDSVGLRTEFRIAFPDYKLPRAIFDADLLTGSDAQALMYRMPEFPSPDWAIAREDIVDEAAAWRSLVAAGLAAETGNSFLALASRGGQSLWPTDLAGVCFDTRRAEFSTRTEIRVTEGGIVLDRALVHPARPWPTEAAKVRIRTGCAPFRAGSDLVAVLVGADDGQAGAILHRWVDLVRDWSDHRWAPIDLLPDRVIVDDDVILVADHPEWFVEDVPWSGVLQLGVLDLAERLARRPGRDAWWDCGTVAELARRIADLVGDGWPDAWLDQAVDRRARLIALTGLGVENRADFGRLRTRIRAALDRPIHRSAPSLPDRLAELRVQAAAGAEMRVELAGARESTERATATATGLAVEVERLRDEIARARSENEALRSTVSWRITAPIRRVRAARRSPAG